MRTAFPRSIRGKLMAGLTLLCLCAIIATCTALYAMWRSEDKIRTIEASYALHRQIHEVKEITSRQRTAVVIAGLALVAGAILVIYLIGWISRPLEAIRKVSGRIMGGETDAIPIVDAMGESVEVRELINSLNQILETLKTKQEQLIQSGKLAAIGRVTAGIAHEINNPLNNISLTAEVLLEDMTDLDNSARREMVRDVLAQADRAREMVHHLLEFSRSRKTEVFGPVDLDKLVQQSILLLKNQFRLGGIHCHYLPAEQKITVRGSANQLQQVLVNLMLNAVQAMASGGHLTLSVSKKAQEALLTVADTGSGIPQEIRACIFDPFFTTKADGTGLGLSLSLDIIRKHHGDIEIKSEPGDGSTFIIHLPTASEAKSPITT